MHKFTAGSYRTMAWKNGGGMTTELAIAPYDASLDDFDWRISTAQVKTAGPFSRFPDIDRSLAVVEGQGLRLHVQGRHPVTLTPGMTPVVFSGDLDVRATLPDGPIIDFNVMTRHTHWSHVLEHISVCGPVSLTRKADLLFIYCVSGSLICCRHDLTMMAGDAALIDATDGNRFDLNVLLTAHLYLVHLTLEKTLHA